MIRSTERILTTHTGSLPRPDNLIEMMFAKEEGHTVNGEDLKARIALAVSEIVRKQIEASYAVLVLMRCSQFQQLFPLHFY